MQTRSSAEESGNVQMFKPKDRNSESISFIERIERFKYVLQMRSDAKELQRKELREQFSGRLNYFRSLPLGVCDYFAGVAKRCGRFVFVEFWFWLGHQRKVLSQWLRDFVAGIRVQPNWGERIAARRQFAEDARAIRKAAKKIEQETRINPIEAVVMNGVEPDGAMARRGLHFVRMVGALAFVFASAFYISYVAMRSDDDTAEGVAKATAVVTAPVESEIDATDLKLAELASQSAMFGTGEKVSVAELNEISDSVNQLSKRGDLSELQARKVELVRTNINGMMFQVLSESHVECDDEKASLQEFCASYESSGDIEMREAAAFWKLAIAAIEFTTNPSDASLASYQQLLLKHGDIFQSNPLYSAKVSGMLTQMSVEHRNNSLTKVGLKIFYDQIKLITDPAVQRTSDKIYELAMFGQFDLPTLRKRLIWGGFTAKEDLTQVLETLKSHPDSGEETWAKVIQACECLLASKDSGEVDHAIGTITQLVSRLPESIKKQRLTTMLKTQAKRIAVARSTVDFNGMLLPGQVAFDPSNHEYSAMIFLDDTADSSHVLKQAKLVLGAISDAGMVDFRAVLAFDASVDVTEFDASQLPENLSIATDQSSLAYQNAFPVDHYPYVVLVDRNDSVLAANIDVAEIESRIARHKTGRTAATKPKSLVQQ